MFTFLLSSNRKIWLLSSLLISLIFISNIQKASADGAILRGAEKKEYLDALKQTAAIQLLQSSLEEITTDIVRQDEKLQQAYTEIKKEEQAAYSALNAYIKDAELKMEITDTSVAEDIQLMLIALAHIRSELAEGSAMNEDGVLVFSPLTRLECAKSSRDPLARLTKRKSYIWYWYQWQAGCISDGQFQRGAKKFGRNIRDVNRIFN